MWSKFFRSESDFFNEYRTSISFIVTILGALYICARLWFSYVAAKVHVLWGIGVFKVPLCGLFFAFFHWKVAKKPFLYVLFIFLLFFPLYFASKFVDTFFNTTGIEELDP